MIDFGNANTNIHIGFGDLGYLDAPSQLSICFRAKININLSAVFAYPIGKKNGSAFGTAGWLVAVLPTATPGEHSLLFAYGDGTNERNQGVSNVWDTGEWVDWVISWGGINNTCYFWKNGILAGSVSTDPTYGPSAHSAGLAIHHLGDGETGNVAPLTIDNVLIYVDHALGLDDAVAYHGGAMPRPDKLSFFWSGDGAPGYNEVKHASGGGEAGTNRNGTPTTGASCGGLTWSRLSFAFAQIARSGETEAPSTSGLMADSMYAELDGRARVFFGLEIDLPDGETLRYSDAALMTEEGLYYQKIKQWSPVRKATSVSSFNIERPETSVLLIDKDRSLAKRLGGDLRGRIEGSAVRERLISKYVPSEDWFMVFNGSFLRWENAGPGPLIRLYFGPNDKPLQRGARLGVIDSDRFPDVGDDVKNTPVQVVAGVHAAVGGAVKAYRISTTEWLVSAGYLSDITEVYENKVASSNSWSTQYSEREGHAFTEVKFTSDPGDVPITVDCKGIELFGDGSGGPITNAADQLVQLLVNFYYSEYRRGPWLKATDIGAPVQTKYLASVASYMSLYGWKGKQILTEELTGYQLINKWADQWKQSVFFTFAGEIAARPNPFYRIPGSNAELREGPDALGPLTTKPRDENLKDEVIVKHDYVFATGAANEETKAVDVSRDYGSSRTINLDYGAS